ncbi:MAG: glycoside hydrolase family 3 protein, partial [Sciscionella sp.]|nr:glycoside hydrolase family 3 protein [Sciscionella sp.]
MGGTVPERGWGTRPAITVLSALALGAVCVTTTQADAATTATSTSEQQAMSSWVSQQLAGMTLEQKVGQLFMTYVHGTAANQADPANKSEFGVDTPAEVVQKYHLGGVIYFANSTVNNLINPTQIAELSNGLQGAALASGAHLPLEISTDQEEGIVTRIGSPATVFPGNMAIGAGRRTDDARKAADITGHELRAMGINVNNAPDADVNSNPANPIIGVRSFAGDPTLAASMDSAAVDGYQDSDRPDKVVSATAKHFPGHGDASTDSHTSLPIINHTKQ